MSGPVLKLPRKSLRYSEHYSVQSESRPGVYYVISKRADGSGWECSCPAWTRHTPRADCKHITLVRRSINASQVKAPKPGAPLPAAIDRWFSNLDGD